MRVEIKNRFGFFISGDIIELVKPTIDNDYGPGFMAYVVSITKDSDEVIYWNNKDDLHFILGSEIGITKETNPELYL